jgi:hypothetical protein
VSLGGRCGRQIRDSNPIISSATPKTDQNFEKPDDFHENRTFFLKTEQFSL